MATRDLSTRFPKFTVQETLNQHLGIVVRLTPSVLAGATDANDVMFESVLEVENAVPVGGGTSRLIGISLIDYDAEAHDMDLVFSQVGTSLGSQDAAVTISDANISKMNLLGVVRINWGELAVGFASNASVVSVGGNSTVAGTAASNQVPLPMLLQAEVGSTSVYLQGIAREAIDYAAATNLDIILHIEYR